MRDNGDEKVRKFAPEKPKLAPIRETSVKSGATDKLFDEPRDFIVDFQFDEKTVAVFDDMVDRSVPFYREIQRLVCELAADFAAPGSNVYDLGCSTGTTLAMLDSMIEPGARLVGVDNSDDMLGVARKKIDGRETKRSVKLIKADLQTNFAIDGASVVIMLLSLMFIRPLERTKLMKRIFDGITENGCLILVEKITLPDTLLNRLFIKNYYEYKRRQGYSEMEISQKREALENVLIPFRYEENISLLKEAGFRQIDEFYRWYNFSGVVAVK